MRAWNMRDVTDTFVRLHNVARAVGLKVYEGVLAYLRRVGRVAIIGQRVNIPVQRRGPPLMCLGRKPQGDPPWEHPRAPPRCPTPGQTRAGRSPG
jgi:hypothetical protein